MDSLSIKPRSEDATWMSQRQLGMVRSPFEIEMISKQRYHRNEAIGGSFPTYPAIQAFLPILHANYTLLDVFTTDQHGPKRRVQSVSECNAGLHEPNTWI